MTDRPILFSAPMVRALLEGRKTQTRRLLNVQQPEAPASAWQAAPRNTARHDKPYLDAYCGERSTAENPRGMSRNWHWWTVDDRPGPVVARTPYAPGDRLWVREALTRSETDQGVGYQTYAADGSTVCPLTKWYHRRTTIPSIHMPRFASRLTLTVTDVRVQRLQEISEADAMAEGVEIDYNRARGNVIAWHDYLGRGHKLATATASFQSLWESLHGPDAWHANPWVAAYTFEVHRCNIHAIERNAI